MAEVCVENVKVLSLKTVYQHIHGNLKFANDGILFLNSHTKQGPGRDLMAYCIQFFNSPLLDPFLLTCDPHFLPCFLFICPPYLVDDPQWPPLLREV